MRRALVFYPQCPYPAHTGSHKYCLSVLRGLKDLGVQTLLFSTVSYCDANKWNDEGKKALLECYVDRIHVWKGSSIASLFDREARDYLNRLFRVKDSFRSFELTPLSLLADFSRAVAVYRPDTVFIFYAYWVRLAKAAHLFYPKFRKVLLASNVCAIIDAKRNALRHYVEPTLGGTPDMEFVLNEQFNLQNAPSEKSLRREIRSMSWFDGVAIPSDQDVRMLREKDPRLNVFYSPISFDIAERNKNSPAAAKLPVYAAYRNAFNKQSYYYFVKKVLPLILEKRPDFKLNVYGDVCHDLEGADGIHLKGFAENPEDIYTNARFAISPLGMGTGIAVKLLEAMSWGLPIISSDAGPYSQCVRHGVNGFLARSAAQFAEYVDLLCGDDALCEKMGKASLEMIQNENSPLAAKRALAQFVDD